jgi:hypothetical protein
MRASIAMIGFSVLAVGCVGSVNSDSIEVESESLSKSSIKILGPLEYGQTSNVVDWTNPPKYSAFSFRGNKGDSIEIWVRSPDHSGDAVAILLDS